MKPRNFFFLLSMLSLLGSGAVLGQPKLFTADLSNQSGTGGVKDYTTGFPFQSASTGNFTLVVSADANGDRYFRFRNEANNNDRRPANNGDIVTLNASSPYTSIFDGNFNAFRFQNANTSYRYIFRVDGGVTKIVIFEIQGTSIQTIPSQSRVPSGTVSPGQSVTITATLSGSFATGQAAFIRYSTAANFSTSTVTKMTGSGTTYTATIPTGTNTAGATVYYYLFTSGDVSAINGGDADLYTINLNNNGGTNYSYTVASTWTTAAATDWNTASTWTSNEVPAANQPVTINHAVTVNGAVANAASNVTVSASNSLTFGASGSLTITNLTNNGTVNMSSGGTLSVANNGSITNNSTFTAGAGSCIFLGTASTTGTIAFNNLTSQGTGTLTLSSGTTTAGTFTVDGTTTMSSSLTTNHFVINANRQITLGSSIGHDLNVAGNWTNLNTSAGQGLVHNNRAITFNGSGDQVIQNNSGTATLGYLLIDKSSGTVKIQDSGFPTDINLTGTGSPARVLQLLNTVGLDLNGRTLTIKGEQARSILINSTGRTITGSAGSALVFEGGTGSASVDVSGSGTLVCGDNVVIRVAKGIDFGASRTTINGTLQIDPNGFLSTNSPTYGSSATLRYATGDYNTTNVEWPNTGGPANVSIALTSASNSVSLNSDKSITGVLTFNTGKLTLGANTLSIGASGSISSANSSKYIVTNGTGSLVRNSVGASDVSFPVGTSTSYNPVTINNSGTSDNFSARVAGAFDSPGPHDPNTTLTRQWTITEAVEGGSNATVTLQFNGSDPAGSLFSHGNPTMYIGRFPVGGPWLSTLATKSGSDPYTVSATFTSFSRFAVGVDASALPVQLAAFTGAYVNATSVRLNWRTVSELNNYGFYIERRRANQTEWAEVPGSFIPGRGTTSIPQEYSYTDNTAPGGALSYRLRQVDLDGSRNYSEPITVDSPTSVKETAPIRFALLQNYPNPFNPSTDIKFSVAKTDKATLTVFNSLGQLVSTLFDETAEAGQYYTVRFAAENLSSGTYFYRLQSGDQVDMKKLVLMK